MSKLHKFFGLNEMARPAGWLSPAWKGALEKARQSKSEFTVQDFAQWIRDSGTTNVSAAGIGTRMKDFVAPQGERPSASAPLVRVVQGVPGKVKGVFKYMYNGPPGLAPKDASQSAPKSPTDGMKFDDEDRAIAKQAQSGNPQWLPKPDHDGDFEEIQMAKLQDGGFGTDNPQLWADIATAENDVAVHSIIKASVPPQLHRAATRVAIKVLKNINKDWEGTKPPEKKWVDDEEAGGSFSDSPDEDEDVIDDADVQSDDEPEADASNEFDSEEPTNPDIKVPDFSDDVQDDEPEAAQAGASNFLPKKPDEPKPASSADRLAAMQYLTKQKNKEPEKEKPSAPPSKKGSVSSFFKKGR